MLNYIVYLRKSSEAKEKQALSIPDQLSECNKIVSRDSLKVHKPHLKESKSAFKPHNRPEFDKLIGLIKSGKANAILCWKPDRLCRNPEEGGILLQMLQDGVIKEIRTCQGDIYTQESDHLILQIHFGMANQYSRNLSQNVKRGLVHKCERGEYPRPALLGYANYGAIGQRRMKLDLESSYLIIKAFEMAATRNYSLSQMVNKLYESGLRTKKNKKVGKSHLYNILTCSTYYGYFYYSQVLYEGNYEPLITKTLFDQVQEALQSRSKPKVKQWTHTYNGLISCGVCGCQITTTVKEKYYKRTNRSQVYTYYHCTHRKGKCQQKAVTGKDLQNLFVEAFENIFIDKEAWELGMRLFKAKHQEEAAKLTKRLRYFQSQLASYRNKLNAIVEMRANEELTKDEFLEQKSQLLEEKKTVEEKLSDNSYSADNWLELCTQFLNTAFSAREIIEEGTLTEKRDLILLAGENLILRDKKLEFSFKKPYDVLLLPEYRQDMLGS